MAKNWQNIRFEDLRITADMDDAQIEDMIRQRVEWRVARRVNFLINLVLFLVVNSIIFGYYYGGPESRGFPYIMIFTFVLWGISLIKRAWALYQSSDRVQERREALIQQQVERARARFGRYDADSSYEKPKNNVATKRKNQPMQVGNDGEIVPLDDLLTEQDDQPRYQNNHRQ